ncbi:hypothetical protein GA0070611_0251 [Micromonospora auratinigra]|uniref:Uncharacterized protein n=2 Tax=Micromonospora auratinigra TaxID=261654 RepID=A0A1A8Z101_9ACTN|nr:hypothetical protein GA0070611_0251 [Micromonospora auratinigra]
MAASLAVVLACSLGTATLPVGPAVAQPATRSAGAADGSAARLDGPGPDGPIAAGRPTIHRSDRVSATANPDRLAGTGSVAAGRDAVPPSALPASSPRPAVGAIPVDRRPAPAGTVPAALGSRAPPVR